MATRLFLVLALALCACRPAGLGGPDITVILASQPAEKLSAYGLFADMTTRAPAAGLTGYDLINPLFSDHAQKNRLVYLPSGQAAEWRDTEVFAFPVGTVLVKSFSYPETGVLETRLLIHKSNGWQGYPYVWNEDRTEAIYSPVGAKLSIETEVHSGRFQKIDYSVPNQNQCKTCHQSGDKIVPIGPKARNLGTKQVQDWRHIGLLQESLFEVASVPSIVQNEGDLASRARAYLDINCAHCHKSDGAASNSGLWLGWSEPSAVRLGIGKHPTAAGRGAGLLTRVIEPGSPQTSILAYRMASAQAGIAMPELGRTLIDEEGVALVDQWILEMQND